MRGKMSALVKRIHQEIGSKEKAIEALEKVRDWVHDLPIPTEGATAMYIRLCYAIEVIKREAVK
jgi:hypothetical protein